MQRLALLTLLTLSLAAPVLAQAPPGTRSTAAPKIGDAARLPEGYIVLPHGPQPMIQWINGGFSVNTDSREQVRNFYNALYPTSENVPQDSTADASNCRPGTNSIVFQEAELRRINWFRAMAGLPANVVLDPEDSAYAQEMAVLISTNNELDHDATTMSNWACFYSDTPGTKVAGGNQGLGFNGPDCITGYIQDSGAKNNEVGHRRWILYPPETVMGTGDAPALPGAGAANLTWVFDPRSFGPRPATRQPYVSWPPEGFVPYPVVFPYWSFALSNADFTAATVSMASNGVPVTAAIQPYQVGFGENTLVWVPMGLDATGNDPFPFNGTDTVYSVTVSNINVVTGNVTNKLRFAYNVTLFDPSAPGTDSIPASISGPAQPLLNVSNNYSCVGISDSNVTGYEWITAQLAPGNLVDNAGNGLANFTLSPSPPNYAPVTTEPFGSGNCFNLEHVDIVPQLLQLNTVLLPATNTTLSFLSELGFAETGEVARVQISTNYGLNWRDVYTHFGNGSYESSFTSNSISLSNCAGMPTLLRFNYDVVNGQAYVSGFPIGWFFTGIVLTNAQAVINQTTNSPIVTATNLSFGTLTESANTDVTNNSGFLSSVTFLPPPYAPVFTNSQDGSSDYCIHLTHDNPTTELLQWIPALFPTNNSTVTFSSLLGFSETNEVARVQFSIDDGATWQDLYAQQGYEGGPPSWTFTPVTVPLPYNSGNPILLRFSYELDPSSDGYFYFFTGPDPAVGWEIKSITLTNVGVQTVTTSSSALSTNFTFKPSQAGAYLLQTVPLIFTEFPVDPGPARQVSVAAGGTPVIVMSAPVLNGSQLQMNFSLTGGPADTFHLLQANPLGSGWTTNATATLSTNVPGSSYRFTTTTGPAMRFYRVQTP